MPYETTYVPAAIFLQHAGVTVFHVYKDDDIEQGTRTYWFDTNENSSDEEGFDVRDIKNRLTGPEIQALDWETEEGRKAIIRAGIDEGLIERGDDGQDDEPAEETAVAAEPESAAPRRSGDVNKQALADALRATLAAFEPYTQGDTAGRPWLEQAQAALAQFDRKPTAEEIGFVTEAQELWASDEIEIDDEGAVVSIGEAGAFVQAWVWVAKD